MTRLPAVLFLAAMTMASSGSAAAHDEDDRTKQSDHDLSEKAAQPADTNPALAHEQLISVNPFGYVFQWYNVEYERKFRSNATYGVTASYATPDDDSIGATNVIARLYPGGVAFSGLYIGGRMGAVYVNDFDDNGVFLGTGIEMGYTWLLGEDKNWYIGMGAGVTRIFGGDLDGSAVVPQVRFINFGYSF